MPATALPPVTDAHRRAAFEAFAWPGLTYEAALRVDLRRRLIEARAHHIRTQEATAGMQRAKQTVRRCRPDGAGWCTQTALGPWAERKQLEIEA